VLRLSLPASHVIFVPCSRWVYRKNKNVFVTTLKLILRIYLEIF